MSARARRRHRRTGRKRNPFLLALRGARVRRGAVRHELRRLRDRRRRRHAPRSTSCSRSTRARTRSSTPPTARRLGYIQSDEARTPVPIDKIPEDLQEATVAIEDERFYDHDGVDLEGVIRAAVENIEAGEVKQGGSTITMQLVRNLYIDDPERDLERKIKEAKLAEELEDEHAKEWILEQYLNTASYGTVNGRTAVGVEAAAQIYFSKPAKELDPGRVGDARRPAAVALAVQPAPEPDAARSSAATRCSSEMAEQGYISEDEAEDAEDEPIELNPGNQATPRSASPTSSTSSSSS